MDIEFRKAERGDLDELEELYRLAVRAMNAAGIIQWDETYPRREHVEQTVPLKSGVWGPVVLIHFNRDPQ